MLIIILILLCAVFFFNLLILGEVVLIKRRFYQKQTRGLPQVKPDILKTFAEETKKIKRAGKQKEEAGRWTDELITEQPCLAEYLKVMASKKGDFDADVLVAGTVMYRLLKAQAEADSLADLTKIQK